MQKLTESVFLNSVSLEKSWGGGVVPVAVVLNLNAVKNYLVFMKI